MKVFISHSNLDSSLIDEFIKDLERLGCKIMSVVNKIQYHSNKRWGDNWG